MAKVEKNSMESLILMEVKAVGSKEKQ